MIKVDDVAAALLVRTGPMTTMKLQKLVFYCRHSIWRSPAYLSSRRRSRLGSEAPLFRSCTGSIDGSIRL